MKSRTASVSNNNRHLVYANCEPRKLLAGVTVDPTGLMSIVGSPQNDVADVKIVANEILATLNGQVFRFNLTSVGRISFSGLEGNDRFENLTNRLSTAHGGPGNDTLIGGSARDDFFGGNEPDILRGNGGNDRLHGGVHNDVIFGGDGDDVLLGADGNDRLFGEAGNDVLRGFERFDRLRGGDGDDQLFGDGDDDHLFGDAGVDQIDGGAGSDSSEKSVLDAFDNAEGVLGIISGDLQGMFVQRTGNDIVIRKSNLELVTFDFSVLTQVTRNGQPASPQSFGPYDHLDIDLEGTTAVRIHVITNVGFAGADNSYLNPLLITTFRGTALMGGQFSGQHGDHSFRLYINSKEPGGLFNFSISGNPNGGGIGGNFKVLAADGTVIAFSNVSQNVRSMNVNLESGKLYRVEIDSIAASSMGYNLNVAKI